jgi:hypothetical protein
MFAPPVVKPTSAPSERPAVAARRPGPTAVAQGKVLGRAIGNQATLRLLTQSAGATSNAPKPMQAKLKIGAVNDPLEHEADRVADQVMRMPASEISAAAAPPQVSRKCAECEEEKLTKKSAGLAEASSGEAPASVHEVLRSPGQPLDDATRGFFEARFGYDFSGVRVHTDARAAESARAVDALAYTVGRNVVFAEGNYASHLRKGSNLLAHELVHVVQQTADRPVLRRYASCRQLLDAPAGAPVAEKSVQDSLAKDAMRLGTVEQELDVPGGSAAPWRTEPGPGRSDEIIDPQVLSEVLDIGGRADIALLNGTTLELLEVKEATWPSSIFAETQLVNYVRKGNRAIGEMEQIWRKRGHLRDKVTSVRGMPQNRLDLSLATSRIDGKPVSRAWCRDGVVVFKALGTEDKEVLYCGVPDRGRTDAFLDSLLGPAQDAAERFVQQQFVTPAVNAAAGNPLDSLLQQPMLKAFVQAHEAEIRAALQALANSSIETLRQTIQADIRGLLEGSAMILCSGAAELTAAEVLAEFLAQLRRSVLDPHYLLIPLSAAPAFVGQPERAPSEESGPSFRERVSEATGLAGGWLTFYLIVSEGSRVIPLRNLIPAP